MSFLKHKTPSFLRPNEKIILFKTTFISNLILAIASICVAVTCLSSKMKGLVDRQIDEALARKYDRVPGPKHESKKRVISYFIDLNFSEFNED